MQLIVVRVPPVLKYCWSPQICSAQFHGTPACKLWDHTLIRRQSTQEILIIGHDAVEILCECERLGDGADWPRH